MCPPGDADCEGVPCIHTRRPPDGFSHMTRQIMDYQPNVEFRSGKKVVHFRQGRITRSGLIQASNDLHSPAVFMPITCVPITQENASSMIGTSLRFGTLGELLAERFLVLDQKAPNRREPRHIGPDPPSSKLSYKF